MITIDIKQFVSAIAEANAFKMPDMNDGVAYLYNNLYNRLSQNMDVKLSDIDFDAFEPEDIDSLYDLHSDVFEKNHYAASKIISTLRQMAPVSKAVDYV